MHKEITTELATPQPPRNPDAEKATLGAVLLDNTPD